VVIDSIDAATEGVGESDSAKPAAALASILDLAHREAGPAVLVLGNVVKSGTHSRGSGVVEDRADICYEVRDATDLQPTGGKPWWLELPPAGREAWAERAVRRKRRDRYRLAFVCSKYRLGEEPEPFLLEIDLGAEPWTLRDVTADLEAAEQAARTAAEAACLATETRGVAALLAEIDRRAVTGESDLGKTAAERLLMTHGLPRQRARQLLREGVRWTLVPDSADDRKLTLRRCKAPAASYDCQSPQPGRGLWGSNAAGHSGSGRPHLTDTEAAPVVGVGDLENAAGGSSIPREEDAEWTL
jgi:hypothetical protein